MYIYEMVVWLGVVYLFSDNFTKWFNSEHCTLLVAELSTGINFGVIHF